MFGVVGGRWFLCNAALALSIVTIRTSKLNDYMPWAPTHPRGLSDRELELLTMMGFAVAVKSRKMASDLELYSTVFKFSHLVNLAMCYLLDMSFVVAYLALLGSVSVLAPEMVDTSTSMVAELKPYEIDEWQKEDKDAGTHGRVRYSVIELMTLWSPPSQYFAPEFALLSLKYAIKGVRFGKVDVEKYKMVARKFGVDINATSAQIPSVILLRNGVEVARLPKVSDGKIVERVKLSAPMVESAFGLPKIMAEVKASNAKAGVDSDTKKSK